MLKNAANETVSFTLDPIVDKGTPSDSRYTLKLSGKPFAYDTAYTLTLKEGINPKNGNIATTEARTVSLRSSKFYTSITANQKIYSATGALVDTKTFTDRIPRKGVFFQIMFDEEVPLDPTYFSF